LQIDDCRLDVLNMHWFQEEVCGSHGERSEPWSFQNERKHSQVLEATLSAFCEAWAVGAGPEKPTARQKGLTVAT